jgi:outer membrane protein assembly factor BamB
MMRRIARVLTLALSTIVMAGCWPVPGQNADRTAHNPFENRISPANVGDLRQAWSHDMGTGSVRAPVASPGGVHAAMSGCATATLDPATGGARWETSFPTCPDPVIKYASPPFVANGDRVLTGFFAWLHPTPPTPGYAWRTDGFAAATGAEAGQWTDNVIAGIRGDDAVFVDPLLIGSCTGSFCSVTDFGPMVYAEFGPLDDASQRRSIRTALPLADQTLESGIPTLGETQLFHAGTGVLATEPGDGSTGRSVRAYSLSESRPGCGPTTTPVECPIWSTPIDGTADVSPVIGPDQATVYVTTQAGTVYALDAATGGVLWTAAVGAAVTTEPALADGTLFVPTADGRLVALAAAGCGAATCGSLWEGSTGSAIKVQPAVAGGVVFTGSDDGSLHAYDAAGCGAATCPALWTASTGSEITGAPAVTNGSVYVGTADGRVVAYR